jgi:formate dehydrogenase subunit gamma
MTLERYPRSARRYHAAIYTVTFVLLATGWWLLAGREGDPSPIARLTGVADATLHVWAGWALAAVAVAPLPFMLRGVAIFVRETLRFDRGDAGWLLRWPMGAITGRFRRHEGHFDPGQRLANIAIVALLLVLILTGIGLVFVRFGPGFVILDAMHRMASIAFTVVIVGHVLIASGVLPGYRGVWRSMHLGGRLSAEVARRLWPGWSARELARNRAATDGGDGDRDESGAARAA